MTGVLLQFTLGILFLSEQFTGTSADDRMGTVLYFYSWENRKIPKVIRMKNYLEGLHYTSFHSKRDTYFIFPDNFRNGPRDPTTKHLIECLLYADDFNILLYHYDAAQEITGNNYIPLAFVFNLHVIMPLRDLYEYHTSYLFYIGYGKGAAIAARAGLNQYGNVQLILALDPAPLKDNAAYLSTKCGKHVQVIHTSQSGIPDQLGHADYYPNFFHQPGCKSQRCSKFRAVEYYGESILYGGFTAYSCQDIHYITSDCKISYLGGLPIDYKARGAYYLETNRKPRYSIDADNV